MMAMIMAVFTSEMPGSILYANRGKKSCNYSGKNCEVLDDRWVVQSVDSSSMFQPCQGAGTVADTNNCQYVVDLSVYILYSIAYKDYFQQPFACQ
jgi:hypothetical protein